MPTSKLPIANFRTQTEWHSYLGKLTPAQLKKVASALNKILRTEFKLNTKKSTLELLEDIKKLYSVNNSSKLLEIVKGIPADDLPQPSENLAKPTKQQIKLSKLSENKDSDKYFTDLSTQFLFKKLNVEVRKQIIEELDIKALYIEYMNRDLVKYMTFTQEGKPTASITYPYREEYTKSNIKFKTYKNLINEISKSVNKIVDKVKLDFIKNKKKMISDLKIHVKSRAVMSGFYEDDLDYIVNGFINNYQINKYDDFINSYKYTLDSNEFEPWPTVGKPSVELILFIEQIKNKNRADINKILAEEGFKSVLTSTDKSISKTLIRLVKDSIKNDRDLTWFKNNTRNIITDLQSSKGFGKELTGNQLANIFNIVI